VFKAQISFATTHAMSDPIKINSATWFSRCLKSFLFWWALVFIPAFLAHYPGLLTFAVHHFGVILVLGGVTGEVILEWHETKKKWLKVCMALLVLGLAIELIETRNQDKATSEAKERASSSDLARAKIELELAELKASSMPRSIGEQRTFA
jgi:hypothetical protein